MRLSARHRQRRGGDGFDILAALSEFGCTSGCTADVNGDDQVTVSDFLEILSQYGEFCN